MTIRKSHLGRDGTALGARRGTRQSSGKEMLNNVNKSVDTNVHSVKMGTIERHGAAHKRRKTNAISVKNTCTGRDLRKNVVG